MPIYEFRCQKCREKFEIFFRSLSKEEKIVCPKCGSSKAERLLSSFGVKSALAGLASSAEPGCSNCPRQQSGSCNL